MSSQIKTLAALEQIQFARAYLKTLLEDIDDDAWFWQPAEGITHIAWQVGHSAVAQHALAMVRVRGEVDEDAALIPADFRQAFGKGSTPRAGAENYPPPEQIRATFDRVYQAVVALLPEFTDEQLTVPVSRPHPAFQTKLGALIWCSQHEMLHAGQIGLLRRMMGKSPLR